MKLAIALLALCIITARGEQRHRRERLIGERASFGCIRVRSRDVIALYSLVHIDAQFRLVKSRCAIFFLPNSRACSRVAIDLTV